MSAKNAQDHIKQLIRDQKRLGKLVDMRKPDDSEPYDPATDAVETEYEDTPVSLRQAFDPELRRLNAELQKVVKAATAEFRKANPQASGLRLHSKSYLTKSKPPGSSKIAPAILGRMMVPGWLQRSQADITAKVREQFPLHSVSKNIWRQAQQQWQLEKLRALVSSDGPTYGRADVSRCKTLSDFKKALTAHAAGNSAGEAYRPTVQVAQDTVTINGHPFKVSINRAKGKEYRQVRINVDVLLEALKRRTKRSTTK